MCRDLVAAEPTMLATILGEMDMAINVMKIQVIWKEDIAANVMEDRPKSFEHRVSKGPCIAKVPIPLQCLVREQEVLLEGGCLLEALEEGALLEGTLMREVKISQLHYLHVEFCPGALTLRDALRYRK